MPPRIHAALVLALVSGACGGEPPPGWIRLARAEPGAEGGRDGPLALELPGGRPARIVREAGGDWLESELGRADWRRRPRLFGGAWSAELGVQDAGRPPDGSPAQRLVAGETAFEHQPPDELHERWEMRPGGFHADGRELVLVLPRGAEPPERATLRVFVGHRASRDGFERVAGRRFAGDGFALWPGERVERVVDLPPGAALRLATAVEPLLGSEGGEGGAPVRFRVTLEGAPLFEREASAHEEALAPQVLPLPAEGRAGARLAFEVEGGLAYASFLAPVVGPREPGRYGERAWDEPRRDVVLFDADTFRADNLAAYGDALGLCPELDAWAEDALVLRQARSVATFTLPAHVSMLAGLFPHQAGVVGTGRGLPEACTTIAEHLSARGWRCVAVTESVFVSQQYGLDQGFELWAEHPGDMERTLARARALIEADDGRPLFLFVHSYRAHVPYAVSEETRARLGARLPLEGEWRPTHERFLELAAREPSDPERRRELGPLVERLQAFYRGGAADLDRGFGRFRADLERTGLGRSAALVFTSDHGEAFYEHDAIYHPGPVWEELVRVPLVIGGRGLPRGVEERPASLVDLAPTLARLAGVPPPPGWLGAPLLPRPPAERPIFLFECSAGAPGSLGIVAGGRKVLSEEDPEALAEARVRAAFDLARDPRERIDVARTGAAWPAELVRAHARGASALLELLVDPSEARLDPAKLGELRAMGYAGD